LAVASVKQKVDIANRNPTQHSLSHSFPHL
jgi:hypothetical protein